MKKLTIILLFLPLLTFAQSPFEQGNRAYDSADYAAAAEHYAASLQESPSAAALYNLGNALYRQGELGQALLCYERAHRLAPRDRDIKENLDFCRSKTEDRIEPLPQFVLARWWKAISDCLTPHEWMSLTLLLLALACAGLCLFFLSKDYVWRKGSLIASGVLALLLLLSALHTLVPRPTEAIVTAPMALVKSSPDNGSTDLFILHEGTKLTLDDQVDLWNKVHIADGQKGWISSDAIELI